MKCILLISLVVAIPSVFQFNGFDVRKYGEERLEVNLAVEEGRESPQESRIPECLNLLDCANKLTGISV